MTSPSHISGGWVRLHRQALMNGWLQNHRLWAFWSYCLLKASHKATTVMVGYQRVPLEAGQFVFGREKAAAELKMTVKQIRTCLDALKKAENVAIKTASKFSIITIVNWNTYQSTEIEEGQQNGQEGASKGPAKGHIQEVKKVRKESIPSSIEEVIAYCAERNRGVDPHKWFNHYEAKGWLIGKNKMKDWRAAVRTWEKNEPAQSQQEVPSFMTDPAFNEESYDAA